MIITQYPYVGKDGVQHENLIKTYSDEGYFILQNETGRKYRFAVDTYPCRFTYSETEEKAPELPSKYKK